MLVGSDKQGFLLIHFPYLSKLPYIFVNVLPVVSIIRQGYQFLMLFFSFSWREIGIWFSFDNHRFMLFEPLLR